MSGTSLDGIDVALLRTDGEHVVEHGPAASFVYKEEERDILRRSLVSAREISDRTDRNDAMLVAERMVGETHAVAVRSFLQDNDLTLSNIDVIGFHGQTVIHRPERGLTVQLGLGKQLAKELGIEVVYDLRAADVAAGGQGAPLVPIYHQALAAKLSLRPVVFVNIGGVANVTFVDGSHLMAFDTGPGNALIDDWVRQHTGASCDENGALAKAGKIRQDVVEHFLRKPYFQLPAPKSLDRNAFAEITMPDISVADGAATLTAITAQSIAASQNLMPSEPRQWIICGGGRLNQALMQMLCDILPNVKTAEDCGFNGDSMEAEAWAYLAVRSLHNLPITFPGTTGAKQPLTGGVLAKP